MKTFDQLNLAPQIQQALANMGFEEATPIQEQTIPIALMGRDLIGQAQTGTGKTAAYGIPLVDRCEIDFEHIQGIVITPTRELAIQVAEELNRIGHFKSIRSVPIYGGQEIDRQIKSLKKKPHIIVCTPGRLMDHMRRRTIRLQQVKMVVLDEADEMLNMGFKEDIEEILKQIPDESQKLLFSATMPLRIQALAREFMKNPEMVHIAPQEVTVANTVQQYIETTEKQKLDILCRLLDMQNPDLAIVFGRTKRRVDEIAEVLSGRGYSAEGLHGDLSQNNRDTIMRKFKAGDIEILVATDVAARGLDITGVTHIYNFDIPQDAESYVHRIGRTGRAGETGLAMTLVTSRELNHLRNIEAVVRSKIMRKPVPTLSEAFAGLQKVVVDSLLEVSEKEETKEFRSLAESLLDEHDSVTLLSAALKMLTKEPLNGPLKELSDAPPMNSPAKPKPQSRPYGRKDNARNPRNPRPDRKNRSY